jgi:hypothetical protein
MSSQIPFLVFLESGIAKAWPHIAALGLFTIINERGIFLNKRKNLFAKWKSKHWDHKLFTCNELHYSLIGFDTPPLRAAWEKARKPISKFGPWFGGVIFGAVIQKLMGL